MGGFRKLHIGLKLVKTVEQNKSCFNLCALVTKLNVFSEPQKKVDGEIIVVNIRTVFTGASEQSRMAAHHMRTDNIGVITVQKTLFSI